MKKTFKTLSLGLVAALACATSAFAASETPAAPGSNFYFEAAYMPVAVKIDFMGSQIKATPAQLGLTLGYQYNKNLAAEAMVGIGAVDGSVKVDGVAIPAELSVQSSYAVFARPSVALSNSVDLFGRVGYMSSKLKATVGAESGAENFDGLAYGFGLNVNLTSSSYITVSYLNAHNKDNVSANALSVGYGIKF